MHLRELANGYPWLSRPVPELEQLIGSDDQLRRTFLVPHYLALTQGWSVVKSIHIQAFGFPGKPVVETEWLQRQSNQDGHRQGIAAFADLSDPHLEDTLQQHCQSANARGIRMRLNDDRRTWRRMAERGDDMQDRQWRRGFALLARHGLVCDLQIYDHQVPEAVEPARDFANTTIIVEHLA